MPVRFVPHALLKLANRASLRAALSTSYLLQMVIVIGLTTGLAWRTIDRMGLYLTRQQQESIAQRINDRLKDDQQNIQELHRAAIDAMTLDLGTGATAQERWLWQQARSRQVVAIALRDAQGRTSAMIRRRDQTLISITQERPEQAPNAYSIGDNGQRLDGIPPEELKQLTLYGALFDRRDPPNDGTLPIVQFYLPNPPSLPNPAGRSLAPASRPQRLAVAFPTEALDQLLDQLYLGQHGFVAVVDRHGQPLASSIAHLDTNTETAGDTALADPQALVQLEQVIRPLRDLNGTLSGLETPQQRTIQLDGRRYQLAISPVELLPKRSLWIVSAIADRDFRQIGHRDAIGFVLISALAALVVGGVNLLKVRTTLRAIAHLQTAIEALGQQRWNATQLTHRPPAFRQVNRSVMQAAQSLRSAITDLQGRNTQLQEAELFKTMLLDDSIQQLSPSLQAIVSGTETDGRNLTKTVKQTLSLLENAAKLSQLQTEQLNLNRLNIQPVALGMCLDAAIEHHRTELDEHDLQLDRHDELSAVFVSVDPRRLEWVLHELIENAIQFSHPGGTIQITTEIALSALRSTYHDLPEVSITITDFGMGIDPSEQHKLFQPFARMTSHYPDRCGYGLGLAIASQTISMMGGQLKLESAGVNCGTTARVILPVVSPQGTNLPIDWNSITDLPNATD